MCILVCISRNLNTYYWHFVLSNYTFNIVMYTVPYLLNNIRIHNIILITILDHKID